jgi:hypothetical protein
MTAQRPDRVSLRREILTYRQLAEGIPASGPELSGRSST